MWLALLTWKKLLHLLPNKFKYWSHRSHLMFHDVSLWKRVLIMLLLHYHYHTKKEKSKVQKHHPVIIIIKVIKSAGFHRNLFEQQSWIHLGCNISASVFVFSRFFTHTSTHWKRCEASNVEAVCNNSCACWAGACCNVDEQPDIAACGLKKRDSPHAYLLSSRTHSKGQYVF